MPQSIRINYSEIVRTQQINVPSDEGLNFGSIVWIQIRNNDGYIKTWMKSTEGFDHYFWQMNVRYRCNRKHSHFSGLISNLNFFFGTQPVISYIFRLSSVELQAINFSHSVSVISAIMWFVWNELFRLTECTTLPLDRNSIHNSEPIRPVPPITNHLSLIVRSLFTNKCQLLKRKNER